MIVRFPFLADSRRKVRFELQADRKKIAFEFHAENMPHYENPNLEHDVMVLHAYELLLFIQIFALLDSISMRVNAEGDLEIHLDIYPNIAELAMRIMASELDLSLDVKILRDSNGHIDMVIKARDDIDPTILINAARTAFFRAWLMIRAGGNVETQETMELPMNPSNVYLRAHDGLSVGPISTTIDELNACMAQIVETWRPIMIGDLDDIMLSLLDPKKIPDYGHMKLCPHLEIAVIKDEEARSQLVLRAVDDAGVQLAEAVQLGYLDELKIGEADPVQNIGLRPIPIT